MHLRKLTLTISRGLQALTTLPHLRNLNLQGNPVEVTQSKEIEKWLLSSIPSLCIYNGKKIEERSKVKKQGKQVHKEQEQRKNTKEASEKGDQPGEKKTVRRSKSERERNNKEVKKGESEKSGEPEEPKRGDKGEKTMKEIKRSKSEKLEKKIDDDYEREKPKRKLSKMLLEKTKDQMRITSKTDEEKPNKKRKRESAFEAEEQKKTEDAPVEPKNKKAKPSVTKNPFDDDNDVINKDEKDEVVDTGVVRVREFNKKPQRGGSKPKGKKSTPVVFSPDMLTDYVPEKW